MKGHLTRLRVSFAALAMTVTGWAAGCAPHPMVEPAFASRAYTPARIAVLPPAVFMVYDEFGDNDPQRSWQLGMNVTQQMMPMVADELRRRGYDVNLSARWDGIFDQYGQLLVGGEDVGGLANSVVQFANSDAGGGKGPMSTPAFVSPELAQRVGWATQSDALLYVNMKGVVVSPGKRTAQLLFVFVVVAIIAAIILGSRDSGKSGPSTPSGAGPRNVARSGASAPARAVSSGPGAPTRAVIPPGGHGRYAAPRGGSIYHGPRVGLGVGVVVPLNGHVHTNEGQVADDDEAFAGDEIYVSLTLVSAQDGRVLWHIRDSVDVEADRPQELAAFVHKYLGLIPQSLAPGVPPAPTMPVSVAPPPPPPPPPPR